MKMAALLELCRAAGYDISERSGWTQVGPRGSVYAGSRDPRVFYLSQRYVDLRRESGPQDLLQRAVEEAPLAGNGQIIARVPYSLFTDSEWARFAAERPVTAAQGRQALPPNNGEDRAPVQSNSAQATSQARLAIRPAPERVEGTLRTLAREGGPTHEDLLAASVVEMAGLLGAPVESPDDAYIDDLVPSLLELADCLGGEHRCRIAAVCLAGKILEICLQRILQQANVKFDEQDTLAPLVEKVRRARLKMPTGWEDAANLVRQFRNGAIHQKRTHPVPASEHVTIVVMALRLILQAAFAKDLAPRPIP